MFDKEGIKTYVGGNSGNSYAAGLTKIESIYNVSVDGEYLNDRCESLLSRIEKDKNDKSASETELHARRDRYSHLKKYVEFRDSHPIMHLTISEQFRQCFKDYAIGTQFSRQQIIDLMHSKFESNPSSIIPSDYCYNMTNKGLSKNLRVCMFINIGTGMYEYVGTGYKDDAVDRIIAQYKQDFTRIDNEERYKWIAIKNYQSNWNIDAEDFSEMYKAAFKMALNLLDSRMYYPFKMMLDFIEFAPEMVRDLFKQLYNENESLSKRYTAFREGCKKLLDTYRNSDPSHSKAQNHYQDLHAVSVYLTFEFPEKYYIYKAGIYKTFRELIGFREYTSSEKTEVDSLNNYFRMCERILISINRDTELITMSDLRLDDSCYKDDAHHLLATDLVYFGRNLPPEQQENGGAYWPSADEYDPNMTVDDWSVALNDRSVTSVDVLKMLKMMLELGGESTRAKLAEVYGNVHSYYNKLGSSFGEKVKNKFKCPDCYDEGKIRYFPIPFLGRNVIENGNTRYAWKIRDELKEALERMDLSSINISAEVVTNVDKNIILYGPPGTGKTYNTIRYAVAIIENKTLNTISSEPYEEVIDRFNDYKTSGQIEFTTFHQSFGYEDFIEGIKPLMDEADDENGNVQYQITPGIFKAFCEKAELPAITKSKNEYGLNDSPTVWKVSLEGTGDNDTRTECLQNGHIRIGYDSYGEFITDETDFSSAGGKKVLNALINRMQIGDIVFSCYSATTIDAIGVVTGEYEWNDSYPHYKRLRNVNWIVKGIKESITELSEKKLTLPSVYELGVSVSDVMKIINKYSGDRIVGKNTKRYVFIIDEINRGNISKIFGELITLIEPSKRMGQLEEQRVKLPYSKKPFGVPDNVYLIGTMNTADRSIAAIDTALRRRFCFKEMMPNAEILEGISVEDISVSDLLIHMNKRITVLYDREHTIGHAYFVALRANPTIDVLADIFKNKIIPLLQEYFYEDYEKIRLVLGDNNKQNVDEQFITASANDYSELFGDTDISFDETNTYHINEKAFDNIEAYRSI